MNVCIIIPIYNEGQTIGNIVASIKSKQLDVVVIDDGSTDDSRNIALNNGAEVLINEVKKGKGSSLRKGFQYALDHQYDGIIAMDGDGQHSVDDLDQFLNFAKNHSQSIITGNRMGHSKGMPLVRWLTNTGMSLLISFACKQKIPDTQCGYRYIASGILKDLKLTSGDFEIETEILIKASKKGFKIFSVPIKTIYRNEKSKINPFTDTIRFFVYFLKEIISR